MKILGPLADCATFGRQSGHIEYRYSFKIGTLRHAWFMVELRTSRPTLIATQLAAAWAVGGIALPIAWRAVLVAAFAGGQGTAGVLALVTVAILLAYLIAVITATRAVSVLGGTPARRVLWALLVLGGGTIGWGSGWAVTDGVGHAVSGSLIPTVILGGLPFVLTAGLLLRGWQLRTAAVGLIVALLGTGAVLLRYESPAEFDQRLEARGVYRQTAYAVAIPGYLPTDPDYGNRFGGSGFHPEDQDVVPPDRFITITAYEQVLPGGQMCGQPTARDSRLTWGECTVEPDGLVYRHNEIEHGYQVPTGDRIVTIVGTPGVDRDLLRIAVLSLAAWRPSPRRATTLAVRGSTTSRRSPATSGRRPGSRTASSIRRPTTPAAAQRASPSRCT